MRQQEAQRLAAENDVMIVIGGRHSSNTAKLFAVCRAECGRAYLIETAAELVLRQYMQFADEIAFLLAGDDSEQQLCEKAIIKTRAYRTAIERMLLAPYGSITLIETKTLQVLAQRVSREKLRKRANDLLAK